MGIFSNGLKVEIGHIKKIPFIEINENSVKNVVVENINIARKNWDSYELSWDFEKHPLI